MRVHWRSFLAAGVLPGLLLTGCSSPPPVRTERAVEPPKPEMVITMASLNLGAHQKRLERSDVQKFLRVLKREQIDVLAVQGIARYPGVETRVDFVDELSSRGDMRSAFGEMMNNSGRQTGNAVFSSFPIRSHANTPFDGIRSVTYEASLQAVVDGGVRDLLVVSTQFPPKAPAADQARCIQSVTSLRPQEQKIPFIVAGNLPPSPDTTLLLADIQKAFPDAKNQASRIWYSTDGLVQPQAAHVVETDLGTLTVARFGVFRPESR